MNYFCTFFDKRYLYRGLALHRSLVSQGAPFHLWVLCMDREVENQLSSRLLPHLTLVTLTDLERSDPRLTRVRENRSLVEFYFTSKSFICNYIFSSWRDVDLLTYIDADGYFFGSPDTIRDEMKVHSIGLSGHRFPQQLKGHEQYGIFNAGFISFRKDVEGLAALTWWCNQCIDWCHDYVDHGRFADQGYLSEIPQRFSRVHIFKSKGINAAPWNIAQWKITPASGVSVLVDGDPLIFYHFHGVKRLGNSLFESGMSLYGASAGRNLRKYIYHPYINELMLAGEPRIGYSSHDIRFTNGAFDWFIRLFPSLGRRLQLTRKIILAIIHWSMIVYRKPKTGIVDLSGTVK